MTEILGLGISFTFHTQVLRKDCIVWSTVPCGRILDGLTENFEMRSSSFPLQNLATQICFSTGGFKSDLASALFFNLKLSVCVCLSVLNVCCFAVSSQSLDGQNIYNGCCTLRIDYSKLSNLTVKFNNEKTRLVVCGCTCDSLEKFSLSLNWSSYLLPSGCSPSLVCTSKQILVQLLLNILHWNIICIVF